MKTRPLGVQSNPPLGADHVKGGQQFLALLEAMQPGANRCHWTQSAHDPHVVAVEHLDPRREWHVGTEGVHRDAVIVRRAALYNVPRSLKLLEDRGVLR